jgi:hypothetical protein
VPNPKINHLQNISQWQVSLKKVQWQEKSRILAQAICKPPHRFAGEDQRVMTQGGSLIGGSFSQDNAWWIC